MISIREWKAGDAKALSNILNNKNIMNNLRDGLPFPYTEKDALDYIKFCIKADKNAQFCFAITYNGVVAGSIGVFRQQNIHFRTAELGYCTGEELQNKGITTEAVKQVCQYVFDNSDIIRIYAEPFARNAASCKVLERAGFVCEGILRSNAVKNGIIEDMKMYSLIKE